jgi:hypothetical protein
MARPALLADVLTSNPIRQRRHRIASQISSRPKSGEDGDVHDEPPTEAEIRRALAECMTLANIDEAMGWQYGSARRRRWRLSPAGLQAAEAEIGGIPFSLTTWGPVAHPTSSAPAHCEQQQESALRIRALPLAHPSPQL